MTILTRALFRARLALLPKQHNPVAKAAVEGLTDKTSPKGKGECQHWARIQYEKHFGQVFRDIDTGDARTTALAFQRAGYAVPQSHGSMPGDLLYKTHGSGGFGHVGIRVEGNMVAQNTSASKDPRDARQLQTLAEFGEYDILIRLH